MVRCRGLEEDPADSYLALGQVDDAVGTIGDVTRRGYTEGAEMLCELAGKLMRSGHEPQARPLWRQARADYPDDVWVYVQAGIGRPADEIQQHAPRGSVRERQEARRWRLCPQPRKPLCSTNCSLPGRTCASPPKPTPSGHDRR